MLTTLGWDIGGANIKLARAAISDGLAKLGSVVRYFPIWRRGKEALGPALEAVLRALGTEAIDGVGVTMTAELSDVYFTKREGVLHILDTVERVMSDVDLRILSVDGELLPVEEARRRPLDVAAANWFATGWLVSRFVDSCIVVDVGSTTTSIIPIVGGRVAAEGKSDPEKLANGELVYTGALRTNVACIVDRIPLGGRVFGVSSEFFASSGDVHLVLGHISESDYTVDTADGRGKSRKEALARLARVICADVETLGEEQIVELARFVYERQVEQVAQALRQVYDRVETLAGGEIPIVVAGIGREFLAKEAAVRIGAAKVLDLEELVPGGARASPAVGLSLMVAEKVGGVDVRRLRWA